MPCIKDDSTVEAIAREYCNNGRDKGKALRTIGYSDSYCSTQGIGVVYSNVRVKAAIERLDSVTKAVCIATRAERQAFWTEIYSDESKSLADRLRASELLGKSECDFVTVNRDETPITLEPLTPEQLDQFRLMAKQVTEDEIKAPKLVLYNEDNAVILPHTSDTG